MTAPTTFRARLDAASIANRSLLCVGLDPDLAQLPEHLRALPTEEALTTFVRGIIEATGDLVCAFKPNLAFFLAYGAAGWNVLLNVRAMMPAHVPLVLDAKLNDMGRTAEMYATMAFDVLGADAVTVNPYLGGDAVAPYLARPDRAAIVLCKTSNPGSGDLQDVHTAGGERFSLLVAQRIGDWGARHGNAGAVVGATYPGELGAIRAIIPDAPILVPGIGAQGGDLAASVRAGADASGRGLLLSASRSVLYASSGPDYAAAARAEALALRAAINTVEARSQTPDAG